jgi:hypothetical protein
MIRQQKLDHEIVWDVDGHLSEVAKSALADGQDSILPSDVMTHFARCEDCSRSVGEVALLSAELSAALAPTQRLSFPFLAVAAAVVVATISAAPILITARSWLSTAGWLVGRSVAIAGHAFFKLSAQGVGPVFYFACTVVLIAMGLAVARFVPRGAVQ